MTNEERTGGQARTPDPDSVREEAERLVATGLAAVSMVADRIGAPTRERGGAAAAGYEAIGDMLFGPSGHRGHSVANDSPECCRCPVCRVISAAREPSPRVAERLATGVGTVAEGAARVLRGLAGATGSTWDVPAGGTAARRDPEPDPWATATATVQASATVDTPPSPPVPPPSPPAAKPVAKPAVKKAVVKKAVKKTAAKKVVAKKAVVKKAVTKTAAKKSTPPPAAPPDASGAAQ